MKQHQKTARCSKQYTLKMSGVVAKTTKGELHGNLILMDSILNRKRKEKEEEEAEQTELQLEIGVDDSDDELTLNDFED